MPIIVQLSCPFQDYEPVSLVPPHITLSQFHMTPSALFFFIFLFFPVLAGISEKLGYQKKALNTTTKINLCVCFSV